MKCCSKCGREKPLSEYYCSPRAGGRMQVYASCKPCHRLVARESHRRRTKAMRARRLAQQARYRADPRYTARDARKAALRAQLEAAGLAHCSAPVVRIDGERPCQSPVAFVIAGKPYCVAHGRRRRALSEAA